MRTRVLVTSAVCALGILLVGRPASAAAERSKIEITIDDVSFLMTQECTGVDPRTGLMHVITRMELTPAPYATKWIAYFTAEGPDDDSAHAFGAAAGIAMFFGMTPQGVIDAMRKAGGDQFTLDVIRLNVWQGPVTIDQVANTVRSALQLFSGSESGGVLKAFDAIGGALGFPPDPCRVIIRDQVGDVQPVEN